MFPFEVKDKFHQKTKIYHDFGLDPNLLILNYHQD